MTAIDQITSSFGGSSAPFVPTDIAGLTLWLKADSLVLSDGDPVASWTDDSGSGNTLVQATPDAKPTFHTNVINGLPAVNFAGTLDVARMVSPSISAITAWTVFFVAKSSTSNSAFFLSAGPTSTGSLIQGFTPTKWDFFDGATQTDFGIISTSAFQVLTCTFGGTPTGTWTLGSDTGHSTFWTGDVAEIFAYNTLLSGPNQTQCQNYLATKYAL